MKANAPEKIYLKPLLMEDGESIVRRCTFERQRDSQIEYTHTDAFIEKAAKWLEDNAIEYWGTEAVDNGMMIDDFKIAMSL